LTIPATRRLGPSPDVEGKRSMGLRIASIAVVFLLAPLLLAAEADVPPGYETQVQPLLKAYCTSCHGSDSPEAGLSLQLPAASLDLTAQHEIWRGVLEKLQTGEMPPADEPQPALEERQTLLAWLVEAVARIDCRRLSQPGQVTMRRLNRSEYNLTIRDLVGVSFRPAEDFPADDVGNGFDNVAEVLSLPTLLMEKYLDSAERIVAAALADNELRRQLLGRDSLREVTDELEIQELLQRFATRAFRRPVGDDEVTGLVSLYRNERQADVPADEAIALPLVAILTSPHFLFRLESTGDTATEIRELTDHELATRLSYFLWSSMPDEQLMALAEQQQLAAPKTLDGEVERMLASPKSVALLENFVAQWLQLRDLGKIAPDPERFPAFSESLRQAMLTETQLFAQAILREDRSVLEFLDADYSYVNEQLATHYGITGVQGPEFRKVSFTDERRGGILTQASILTLTSNPTRTSPVKRGKWILENMLGTPPPPPPPGVQELQEGQTELLGSLRERMEQHRADPNCAVCHTKMDALGFGFENFDAVGAWREMDGRFPIDPSGSLPGNQQFQGPAQLRRILRDQRRDQFLRCLTEKMLMYALGRELQSFDRCATDEIVDQLAAADFRFSALVKAIVRSEPFLKRGIRGENK